MSERSLLSLLALVCLLAAAAFNAQAADNDPDNAPPGYLSRAADADIPTTDQQNGDSFDVLEAVRVALSANPDLAISRLDISTSRGALQSAQGDFDFQLQFDASYDSSHTLTPDSQVTVATPPDQKIDTTSLSMGVTRKFRTGVETSISLQSDHYRIGPLAYEPYANAKVVFGVTVPLMKGLGQRATGGAELAAEKDLESSLWQSRHTAAETVRDVAQAYWSYMAAQVQYKQAANALERAKKLLQNTNDLIAGGQQAAADIYQAKAQVADKVIKVVQAEQSIVSARQSLGEVMGLSAESIANLPDARGGFPTIQQAELKALQNSLSKLQQRALKQRADYLASDLSQEAQRILAEQSRLNLKPQLDAFMKVGYTGLEEGDQQTADMLDAFGEHVGGADAKVGLTYYFPIENRDARGQLAQALASLRKQKVTTKNLARKIKSQVHQSLSQVVQGFDEVEQSRDLVRMYEKSVEVEERKSRLGESTLIDVINTEDRLYEAWVTLVQGELDLANALIDFRYQTGTLVNYEGETGTVERSQLFSLPVTR